MVVLLISKNLVAAVGRRHFLKLVHNPFAGMARLEVSLVVRQFLLLELWQQEVDGRVCRCYFTQQ